MDYDPSRKSLLDPGAARDFFPNGRPDDEAALGAEMSRLAYCRDESVVGGVLAGIGYSEFCTFDRGGSQALMAWDGPPAVLAFRGTEADDPTDIIDDALFLPEPWPAGGNVHMGFAGAFERIWPEIEPQLAGAGPILFTGHSLGAALATLAASRQSCAGLLTYGSPRVGDRDFGQALAGQRIRRFVNCCDLVCRVPPEPCRHVGELHYIDRDRRLNVSPDPEAIESEQWRAHLEYTVLWAWRWGNLVVRDLADHAPVNYSGALL